MASKWGRIFKLVVATADGSLVTIETPFTCEFQVTRQNLARANTASFKLYNLNDSTRKLLFKDPYDISVRRPVVFTAGYEVSMESLGGLTSPGSAIQPEVFNGEVRQCFSVRQGADYITEMECFDGGLALAQSVTTISVPAGTDISTALKTAAKDLLGIDEVTVGNIANAITTRGMALFGNTSEVIKELAPGQFYIDSQKAYVIDPLEVVSSDIDTISPDTGLLGTPRRSDTMIEVDMLFEPRLRPSQMVTLLAQGNTTYNGVYKIAGYTHRGIISGAKGGECRTTATLWTGAGQIFKPVLGA